MRSLVVRFCKINQRSIQTRPESGLAGSEARLGLHLAAAVAVVPLLAGPARVALLMAAEATGSANSGRGQVGSSARSNWARPEPLLCGCSDVPLSWSWSARLLGRPKGKWPTLELNQSSLLQLLTVID